MLITKDNTVIDGLDIYGFVRVEAKNVTIRNTRIHGRAVSTSAPLIYAASSSVRNLLVEDVELAADRATPDINGIMGSNFTLRRVNIHRVIDSVHIFGDNVTVEASWLHDNLHYAKDPNWNGGPSHDDSIQIQKGTNIRINGNSISGAKNAAMQITQNQAPTSNVTFTNNTVSGGACSLNVSQAGPKSSPIRGLTIANNVFGSSIHNCPMIIDRATIPPSKITGNTRTNGSKATVVAR